jgi:hypothetical protein
MNKAEAIKSLNINVAGAMIAIARPAKRAASSDALIASIPSFFETLHSSIEVATSLMAAIAHRIPHPQQHKKAFPGYQANSARAGP